MKVIVTGAAGLLGFDVWRSFEKDHDLMALGRTQPIWVPTAQWLSGDLTDAAKTYATVTRVNPDLIIHCAAYNKVDLAQTQRDEAFRGNALATRNLALACQRFDTALMHVSSDYVFDGLNAPDDGYREFDATHPMSCYGESKRWAEIHVEQLLHKFFIVRTSWLFGPSRATWVDQILALADEGKPVMAASDMVSAPTYTPDLAGAMLRLAESHHYGTYHLTNHGFCSRVQLAEEVLRLNKRGSAAVLQRLTLKELKLPAPRPHFSGLENLAWRLEGFEPLRSWKEALKDHFAKAKVVS
jgi:dTDP-4-dehydrorhamnose reductase